MYRANYLGQSISVCRATSRKVQSIPKDRAKKILGTFKNRPSKVYTKFLLTLLHIDLQINFFTIYLFIF
jgi:hypothetical protein